MTKGTVFFDYDGTLHDTMKVYGPAFRKAVAWLESQGYLEHSEYDDVWISHWLGWTTKDMWTTFAPHLKEDIWRQAAQMVGEEMDSLSSSGKGALFEGIPETLQALKEEGYTIAFLSNCRHGYRDAHRGYFNLDQWFNCYHCAADYPDLKKSEIYQKIANDGNHPFPHVMVGDRFHDIEVAVDANIPSVGCLYGYGMENELRDATVLVESPHELTTAIKELLS